jgi:hypothetical protein
MITHAITVVDLVSLSFALPNIKIKESLAVE